MNTPDPAALLGLRPFYVMEITAQAKEFDCDLIILGAKKGLFSKTSVGGIIKTVLKESKIPVTVVPKYEE